MLTLNVIGHNINSNLTAIWKRKQLEFYLLTRSKDTGLGLELVDRALLVIFVQSLPAHGSTSHQDYSG